MITKNSKALTKLETVALWHAIKWMESCIREAKRDGIVEAWIDTELVRLSQAKSALRKVNALRKIGAAA